MSQTTRERTEVGSETSQASELPRESRRQDRLLALLVHELRNPLTAVRNSVSILRLPGSGGAVAERALEQLDRQTQQLSRLLEEVMDLSQLLQGRLAICKELVRLPAVIAQVEAALRPVFAAQNVRLEIAPVPQDISLVADLSRFPQMLRALLLRALKYTPAGGFVRLDVEREDKTLLVRVKDNGFGILPEVLSEFFNVSDDAPVEHMPGTAGTGLLLARGLAQLHGGTITVSSAGSGQGSELTLQLPLSGSAPAPTEAESNPPPPRRAVRVLCVDDEPDIADSLAQLLHEMGHEVRVAHSGPEALALVGNYRPEVVLLDLNLPGMDGYELAGRLRQQPGLEGVRLVAVSGYGAEDVRQRARAAGIEAHLLKPARANDLERVLIAKA
jgi:CheY-like chemotaxis protein